MGFFDGAFYNCPSYTYQMFVYGIFITILMSLMLLIGNPTATMVVGIACGLLYFCLAIRSLYHMVDPNLGCAYSKFPNDRGINPWAS